MVVAIRISPPIKGRTPKLSMLELVTVVDNRYSASKLRKRILPQGFCYVCSRIDPGGIFRNQNSYLFQKGFFHACEHFPQAPQTTFIGEEINVDLNRKDASTRIRTRTLAPSISVTIKHDPELRKIESTPRKTTVPSRKPAKRENAHVTPSVKYNSGANRFPAIGVSSSKSEKLSERKLKSSTNSIPKPESVLRAKTLTSIELHSSGCRSKQSGLVKTVSSARDSDTIVSDRITIIPTALDDEIANSDDKSDLTAVTTTALAKRDADIQTITTVDRNADRTQVVGATGNDDVNETTPFINKSDGLGSMYAVEPLIKEVVMLGDERSHGNPQHRTRGVKEKNHGTDTDTDGERPESGHLRYHHRGEEDTVPHPGFDIPPTPSVEEQLQLEREEFELVRKEAERKEIERQIAMGYVDGSVIDDFQGSVSDDISLRLTDARSGKSSRPRLRPTLSSSSSMKGFCQCPSDTRETSFMKSTCLICGKGILYGNSRRSRESSITQNEAAGGAAAGKRSPKSSVSDRSRQLMLYQNKQNNAKGKAKSVSDEDYMDLESIIHEDDGRYWSSDDDDDERKFMTRSAILRYRNAKPFPLVDPNLHKLVYIKALREANLRAAINAEEDEFNALDKLRHPHTFSYFPLLPGVKREVRDEPGYIGLKRPNEEVSIKNGQFMRHIFGDIDFEQLYKTKSSKKVRKHSILDITDTALLSSDRVSTTNPEGNSPETLPNIVKDDERTSVSLKMRKSGVNFESGP